VGQPVPDPSPCLHPSPLPLSLVLLLLLLGHCPWLQQLQCQQERRHLRHSGQTEWGLLRLLREW
jgi:hypothetical protein